MRHIDHLPGSQHDPRLCRKVPFAVGKTLYTCKEIKLNHPAIIHFG
jgi:hypothetical protein